MSEAAELNEVNDPVGFTYYARKKLILVLF